MKRVKSILLSFYLQNLQHSVQNNYIYLFFLHQYLVQYLCKRFFLCHAFKSCWYNQAHLSFLFPGNCGNNRIILVSFKEAVISFDISRCMWLTRRSSVSAFILQTPIAFSQWSFASPLSSFMHFNCLPRIGVQHTLINMMPSYVHFKLHLEDQVIQQRYRSCHCM